MENKDIDIDEFCICSQCITTYLSMGKCGSIHGFLDSIYYI